MSGDCIQTKTLSKIVVQENGIICDGQGQIIGRLVDSIKFEDLCGDPNES